MYSSQCTLLLNEITFSVGICDGVVYRIYISQGPRPKPSSHFLKHYFALSLLETTRASPPSLTCLFSHSVSPSRVSLSQSHTLYFSLALTLSASLSTSFSMSLLRRRFAVPELNPVVAPMLPSGVKPPSVLLLIRCCVAAVVTQVSALGISFIILIFLILS